MGQNVQAPSHLRFYMINAGFALVILVRKLSFFYFNGPIRLRLDFEWFQGVRCGPIIDRSKARYFISYRPVRKCRGKCEIINFPSHHVT